LQRKGRVDFVRYALFGCVLVSGLGGIIICLVGFKYGLVPPADDDPIELTRRRLFATHLAHAFAAVAFAITAMLAGTVLMIDRGPAPVSARDRHDVQVVEQRLDGVEALVRRMTDTLEQAIRRSERAEAADSRR
jgi:hypothetical protein